MLDCNLQHIKLNTLNSLKDSGLGNMLFQISCCYGTAKRYNLSWQISDINMVNNLLKKYGGNHNETIYRNIIGGSRFGDEIYLQESSNLYDREFLENISNNLDINIMINGYFQSYKYFDFCKKDILKLFEIDKKSRKIIKNKYPIIFSEYETVAIHIRNNRSSNLKYNEEYFLEAIKYIEGKKNTPLIYLIFSDDNGVLENSFFQNIKYKLWIKDNLDYIDLWAMSLCKNIILSHSTLCWWGAYLNKNPNKIVIYPGNWVNEIYKNKNKHFLDNFKGSHYPSDWINLKSKVFI